MIEEHSGFLGLDSTKPVVVSLAMVSGIVLGIAIAEFSLGWREMIIMLLGTVALLAILVPDKRIMLIGLSMGVVSIAFGWRTFSITPNLSFAPFEFIIWFLASALLLRSLVRREEVGFQLSMPTVLFLALSIPASVTAWMRGTAPDVIIGFGKNVIMFGPFFFVLQNLVPDLKTWKRIMFVAVATSVYLSLTGLSLVAVPSLGNVLSGPLATELVSTGSGFMRVGFAGWGPLAAWFFVLVFGAVLGFWDDSRNRFHRLLWTCSLTILGAGILVSGQRGAWTAGLAGLAVYAMFNRRRGLMLVAMIAILIFVLPQGDFAARFVSAFDPALYDGSAADRYGRAANALDTIAKNPIGGLGFGGLTYVHSDYLEIGAGMGLGALGLFVVGLGITGWRLVQVQFSTEVKEVRLLGRGTLVMFVMLLVELASAGFITLSFTAVLIWFFWAMSEQFAVLVRESIRLSPPVGDSHLRA